MFASAIVVSMNGFHVIARNYPLDVPNAKLRIGI